MRISSKVKIPADMRNDSGDLTSWLITKVGLQTVSWEWIFHEGEIFVGFYNEARAEDFKKAFGL